DLEDAVAPDAKAGARDAAVAAAKSGAYGKREVLIRVNSRETPWCRDDVVAAGASGADGIVLPKVNTPADVQQVADWLSGSGAPKDLAVWAMMETPLGILNVRDIAQSSVRLAGLCIGTADLAKDLHCHHPADRGPMMTAIQICILTARAYGLYVLDGVHVDLSDDAGYAMACMQSHALGFDGKTLIHPKQIAEVNAVFAPNDHAVAHARKVVAAHAEARKKGQGVTTLDGKLVEVLHVQEAERLLAYAEAIAQLEAQNNA
ncbi:MAG: CoA ester lyase, partial [Rhodobacteraceae bacterium]|nr:CoA ester lyase [Paracoccaceae bacterium]